MAEEPEVTANKIEHELEETRHSLADKLSQLGEKITGTVENVEHTVENVTETASETVEAVKETVSGTVETVKETVAGTVETVRETFNLQRQMQERPWLVLGGAFALGFIGGKLIDVARPRSSYRGGDWQQRQEGFASGTSGYRPASESAYPQQAGGQYSGGQYASEEYAPGQYSSRQSSSGSSWFSGIMDRFGSEINTLKGLAIGSLFGVVRDMVAQKLPESLKGEVTGVLDNMASHAGGKPIQGPVLQGTDQGQQESGQQGQGASGSDVETSARQESPTAGSAGQEKSKRSGGRQASRR